MNATRQDFLQRSETFGFDTAQPWAMDAFRLLFCVPRAYRPLVDAWAEQYPSTRRGLRRLVADGWVEYQPGLILDTRSGLAAPCPGRPAARYRTTAKGVRLLESAAVDLREAESTFPRTSSHNLESLLNLLEACDLEGSHAKFGLSGPYAAEIAGFAERTGRWWVARLVKSGHLRRMTRKVSDVREVIPAHWRVTRKLCRQLARVVKAFEYPASLKAEFRLSRERFLGNIDPARLGITGATDFDHDVETQRILAALFRSPHCAQDARVAVEPRYVLPLVHGDVGVYAAEGTGAVFYLPDAELRELHQDGAWRSVIEYERYQSRRDGWDHIERFLGYLHTKTLPFESAVLRFVVDSPQRVRSYIDLINAFADHLGDHPAQRPAQNVRLAVTSVENLLAAEDPLDWATWTWVSLLQVPEGATPTPLHHGDEPGPYDDYFTRS
jgi:hypothetical protein